MNAEDGSKRRTAQLKFLTKRRLGRRAGNAARRFAPNRLQSGLDDTD